MSALDSISDNSRMEEYSAVLSRLQSLCSKRECCSSDVYGKALAAFDGDSGLAGKLLQSLVEDKYVDDLRYSSAFARDKSRLSGWGPAKIAYTLRGKGIDRTTIAEALRQVDPEEAEARMRTVLETKYRTLKGDPHEKFKLLKFGLTRGYEYDKIAPVVDDILNKNS